MKYKIGQLAAKAKLNIETIRYYERTDLIKRPSKPTSGYRQYSDDILQRLLFIKRSKLLGFTLKEIKSLLILSDGKCNDVKEVAQNKLIHIQSNIHDLQLLAKALTKLIKECNDNNNQSHCPIIKSLID